MLLAVDDFIDHAWSYFLNEKPELKDVMVPLIKDLKTSESIDFRYDHYNSGENEAFEKLCKQEGIGVN